MRAKFINEKFTANSDPIQDMNIGGISLSDFYNKTMIPAIKEWYDYLQSFYGKQITITDIYGKKHTFILKEIKIDRTFPTDCIRFAQDLHFCDMSDYQYKIDLSKRIFVHE
jgi:hypothetical protein